MARCEARFANAVQCGLEDGHEGQHTAHYVDGENEYPIDFEAVAARRMADIQDQLDANPDRVRREALEAWMDWYRTGGV